MRRAVVAGLAVLGVLGAAFALTGAGGTSGGYRIDAIFDNASFLIPGQDVKIAGARVGKVVGVKLTPDHRARIQMAIDPEFAPFRSDADCTIQPQSLIGEKFIQCSPGTPRGQALRRVGDTPPTVPLARTHAPIDLDLVMATFRRPVNERFALLLNELGEGLTARGDDLNATIRRAYPALAETRRVLAIVASDRARIHRLIGASADVVDALAARRERIGRFVDTAQAVARTTAQRSARLGATVHELPGLLREAQPSLAALRGLAVEGTPVLRDLRAASPDIRGLAADAAPLTAAARPALTRLGTASTVGRDALTAARPVVRRLRSFAGPALPAGRLVSALLQSMRTSGAVEGLQTFAYNGALAMSRFDRWSHILPAHLVLSPECSNYATTPVAGCSAHFVDPPAAPKARRGDRHTRRRARPERRRTAGRPAAPAAPQDPGTAARPAPSDARPKITVPGLPPIELPDLGPLLGGNRGNDRPADGDAVGKLLDYLLR